MHHYLTIAKPAVAEFKDKGSRFIANAYPFPDVNAFKPLQQQLKKEHPKAVHLCFAYRNAPDGSVFRTNDDGEPSGSGGRPILHAIDAKGVTDTLVFVVRYFGGTLLGVPGLINAYRSAASLALQLVPTLQMPIMLRAILEFDYTLMNEVMMVVKQNSCTVLRQEASLFVVLEIGIPKAKLVETQFRLGNLYGVRFTVK